MQKNLPNVYELLTEEQQLVPIQQALKDVELVGLYFSAHWCPPCRQFTPFLAQFYEAVKDSKKMEIIFVSSDKVEQTFKDYFSMMGFKAVPYDDDRDGIKSYHGVKGIPVLPLFSKSGVKLTDNLRMEVMQALQDDKVDELVQKYIDKAASLKPDPNAPKEEDMPQINDEQKTASVLNEQQEAALKLFKSGASFDLVQKCLGKNEDLSLLLGLSQQLNIEIKDTKEDPQDINTDIKDTNTESKDVCQLDEEESKQPEGLNFDFLMTQINQKPDEEFIDKITFEEMNDPVVLSSGHVFDRSTVMAPNGKLKLDKCPITRQSLEPKVFPLAFLKAKLIQKKIARLNQLIFIATTFKHDEEKFNMAIEKAENILKCVKEDVYKAEASKLGKLMISSPYLKSPEDHAKCFVRVIKTLHGDGRASFVKMKIQEMHRHVVDNLKKKDFETAKVWLETCENVNKLKMDDFKFVLVSQWWIKLMQLCPSMFDEATYAEKMLNFQIQAYQQVLKDKGEAEGDKFLKANKLNKEQIIDKTKKQTPIQLKGIKVRIAQSVEELCMIHSGTTIDFIPKQIVIKDTKWTDQGWGNQKGRLFIRLYRGQEIIKEEDIFGICDRSGNQKDKTYTDQDEIVNLAQIGDKYMIYGRSGGGGGHELKVQQIQMTINAIVDDITDPKVLVFPPQAQGS